MKFTNNEWVIELPQYEIWNEDDECVSILPKDLPVKINNVGRCEGIINDERCTVSPRDGKLCGYCKKEAERIASGKPKRKPTTCSICKETGHNKSVCEQNPKVIRKNWVWSEWEKHYKLYEQDHSYKLPKFNELEEEWERMQ